MGIEMCVSVCYGFCLQFIELDFLRRDCYDVFLSERIKKFVKNMIYFKQVLCRSKRNI